MTLAVDDDDCGFDIDAYVLSMHAALTEQLGDSPEVRLAVAEIEISHIVSAMLIEYGVEGVYASVRRIRDATSVAERNALGSNRPMLRHESVS